MMGAVALFFGSGAVVAADYWLKNNVQTVIKEVPLDTGAMFAADPERTIVVAGQALNYGDEVSNANMREVAWAADDMPDGSFSTIEELLEEGDRAALGAIALGEPVLASKITGSGAAPSLSKVVTPGYRAVSVEVDERNGVSGFIVPGDRVDVIVVREFGDSEEDDKSLKIASTAPHSNTVVGSGGSRVNSGRVLANIRVLSVDQTAKENTADPILARTVALEVLPTQATLLIAAQRAGSLSLHLRKAGDVSDLGFMPTDQGIDFSLTSAFGVEESQSSKNLQSIRVRMGDEVKTHEVSIEGAE
jgi:pilus assembly protein CpaB